MKKVRENILILADLSSPLMKPRIMMLKDLPYNKYILHNANNIRLDEATLSDYTGFNVLQHPRIISLRMRYLYSFFYTLFLLLRLKPKLIVVHWASRLYQNLLLALWGKCVIVHTMGGDIDKEQDYFGKKKFFIDWLLEACKIISVKSDFMRSMILTNNHKINSSKIKCISWGVAEHFFEKINCSKEQMQYRLFGRKFDCLFFSVRAFNSFYRQKEIIESFLEIFGNNLKIGLIVSGLRIDNNYYYEVFKEISENVLLCHIPHNKMGEYIFASDYIVSFAKSDGLPQSIMEGLIMGRWILCNNLPNYCELLNNDNAILLNNDEDLVGGFLKALKIKSIGLKPKNNQDIKFVLNANLQKQYYLQILKENFDV
ncbi:hypothetical protein NCR96_06055 [Helicobacter sp. 14348-15]|uniref:hypothetical protein n=1 Tax=Helicobacter colisuis TaxID=2949739 RepID=UPI00202B3806|nr:hypothetical protein [Helicobacter colisuis]MCL9821300.1 hypothetical protein [Helicobacter colisuis]